MSLSLSLLNTADRSAKVMLTNNPLLLVQGAAADNTKPVQYAVINTGANTGTVPTESDYKNVVLPSDWTVESDSPFPLSFPLNSTSPLAVGNSLIDGTFTVYVRQQSGVSSTGAPTYDVASTTFVLNASKPVLPFTTEIFFGTTTATTASALLQSNDGTTNGFTALTEAQASGVTYLPNKTLTNSPNLIAYASLPYIADASKVELRVGDSIVATYSATPGDAWATFNITGVVANASGDEKALYIQSLFGNPTATQSTSNVPLPVTITIVDTAGNRSEPSLMANKSWLQIPSGTPLNGTSATLSPNTSSGNLPFFDKPIINGGLQGSTTNSIDDTFFAGTGNQFIYGGKGSDTYVPNKPITAYTISNYTNILANPNVTLGLVLTDGASGGDGIDTLQQIEFIKFINTPATTSLGPVYDIYDTNISTKIRLLQSQQGSVIKDDPTTENPLGVNTIVSGSLNDSITGGTGNDSIDGGAGTDTAYYSGDFSNYTISQLGVTPLRYSIAAKTGTEGTDTVQNVEQFSFAGKIVTLTAPAAPSTIVTTFTALSTAAPLAPSAPGTATDDVFAYTSGNASIDGLAGTADTVTFPKAASNYTLSLDSLTGSLMVRDDFGSVMLKNVEVLSFAGINYTFSTSSGLTLIAKQVDGLGTTNDNLDYSSSPTRVLINGFGGNDTLKGGLGDDTLTGGLGNDSIVGGPGKDTAVINATLASVTSITQQTLNGVNAYQVISSEGTDQLVGVEYLRINDPTTGSTKTIELASQTSSGGFSYSYKNQALTLVPNVKDGIVELSVYFTPTETVTPLALDVTLITDYADLRGDILNPGAAFTPGTMLAANYLQDGNVSVLNTSGSKPVQSSKITLLNKGTSQTVGAQLTGGVPYLLGTFKYNLLSGAPSTAISGQVELITNANEAGKIFPSNPVLLGFSDTNVGNQAYSETPVNSGFDYANINSPTPKTNYLGGDLNDLEMSIGLGYVIDDGTASGSILGSGTATKNRLLWGFGGNDILVSGDGNDTFLGGSGNDFLFASSGVDLYSGGDGYDKLDLDLDNNTVDLTNAANSNGYVKVIANGQNKSDKGIDSVWYLNSIEAFQVLGTNLADVITGSNGDDTIIGGDGFDFITPGLGTNEVYGTYLDTTPIFFGTSKNSRNSFFDGDTLNYEYKNGISLDLNTYTVKPANGSKDFFDKFSTINKIISGSSTDNVTGKLKSSGTMPDGSTYSVKPSEAGESFIQLSLGGGSDIVTLESLGYQYSVSSVRVNYDWLLQSSTNTGVSLSYNKVSNKYIPSLIATTVSGVTTYSPEILKLNNQTALAKYNFNGVAGIDLLTNVASYSDSLGDDYFDFSNHIYADRGFYSSDPEFRSASDRVRLQGLGGNDIVKGNGHTGLDFSASPTYGLKINLSQQARPTTQFDLYYGNNNNPNFATATLGDNNGSATYTLKYNGVDSVRGTKWNDTLIGGSDMSWMPVNYFDIGTEWFSPQGGDDTITGGRGYTGITYSDSPDPVTFDVWTGKATGAWIGNDTFSRVVVFEGSEFNDVYNADSQGKNLSLYPNEYPLNKGWGGTYNFFKPNGGDDTIVGNGNTRISYDNAMVAVTVDLRGQDALTSLGFAKVSAPPASAIFDNVGNDTLKGVLGIVGSMFGDALTGDSKNNFFRGNAGADTIVGSTGVDTADYANSPAPAVIIESATTQNSWDAKDGWGFSDVLTNIRDINASPFNDFVKVNATGTHVVQPNRGNDIVERVVTSGTQRTYLDYGTSPAGVSIFLTDAAGNDYTKGFAYDGYLADNSAVVDLVGTITNLQQLASGGKSLIATSALPTITPGVLLSTDSLKNINAAYGSNFDDYFLGGADGDYFLPRSGFDTIDGGTGNDTVSFGETPILTRFEGVMPIHGVYLDLNQKADAQGYLNIKTSYGDQFIRVKNVENFDGSKFNDTMIGNSLANVLNGDDGDDTIIGGDGNDTVSGGAGNDLIDGGSGNSDLMKLPGKLSDYSFEPKIENGVSYFYITSATGAVDAGTDRVTGVEFFDFGGTLKDEKSLNTNYVTFNATISYAGDASNKITNAAPTLAALSVEKLTSGTNTLSLKMPPAYTNAPTWSLNGKEFLGFNNTETNYTDGVVVKVYESGVAQPTQTDKYNSYVVTNASPSTFSLNGYAPIQAPASITTSPMYAFSSTIDSSGKVQVSTASSTDFRKGTYLLEAAQVPVTKQVVDTRDVLLALSMTTSSDNTIPYYKYVAADLDQTGQVDISDVINLLKMSLQKSDALMPKLITLPASYASMTNATSGNTYSQYITGGAKYPSPSALASTPMNLNYLDLTKATDAKPNLVGIWTGDINANFYIS